MKAARDEADKAKQGEKRISCQYEPRDPDPINSILAISICLKTPFFLPNKGSMSKISGWLQRTFGDY